jgi:predicted transglutaminase-like cysteine proteinase
VALRDTTPSGVKTPPATSRSGRRAVAGALAALLCLAAGPAAAFPAELFGYRQVAQQQISDFPQWLGVLERHLKDDLRDGPDAGDCRAKVFNRCHMAEWQRFLAGARGLPPREQLLAVNRFANTRDYALDIDNYGLEDYWAIPREFLANGGDCEDYVITKLFSLLWLGYPPGDIRLVVVQDTNLRVPHAVLAVVRGADTLILDNQVQAVLTDREVVHYVPVFSLDRSRWWIHLPAS